MEKKKWRQICTLVVGAIFLYWGLAHYELVLGALTRVLRMASPFILGGAIAFIFNVPMTAIERHLDVKKYKRVTAYLITLFLMVGIFTFCLFVLIPQISKTIQSIAAQVPAAFAAAQKKLEQIPFPEIQRLVGEWNIDWGQLTEKGVQLLQSSAAGIINSGVSMVGGIINGVTDFVIGLVFSIYVLLQKEKLGRQLQMICRAFFKEEKAHKVLEIGRMTHQTFSKFISGQCTEALILGAMFFVAMWLLQIPYPLVISVLITITALVPIVGAFVGCIVGAFLIVMVSPIKALIFIGLFLVLQQIEGNLIYPHVVGNSVGLPSIWVLVAVTIGGDLMGIVGMLVFIPLCSVAYVLLRQLVQKKLAAKERKKAAEQEP